METPVVPLPRATPRFVALAAIVGAASVSRLAWLNLMEFKSDEANACRLALHVLGHTEPGVGRFFPTAGLVSSVGIPNPPLFVYLVALPLALVRSPIAAAAAIGAANVVAVWLSYVVGRRLFGSFVGVATAAMLALSPWGIVFSRKIWAQDLLPVCTTLFTLQLHALLVDRKPRAVFGLVIVTAAATQLHFSAVVLVLVLLGALVVGRHDLAWRWLAAGLVVAGLLYTPYVIFHTGAIFTTVRHHASYTGPDTVGRFRRAGRDMLGIVGGGNMRYLIGKGSRLAAVLSILLGLLAPLGLVTAARRESGRRRRVVSLLALWYALPLAILTALEIRPYMHYFIILLPLPYLGLAYLGRQLFAWRPSVAVAGLALTLVCFLLLDVSFFRTIIHSGGARGDYGIGYENERRAIRFILDQVGGKAFRLRQEPAGPVGRLRPYRFLIWNATQHSPAPQGPAQATFVLLDRFHDARSVLHRAQRRRHERSAEFGPVMVIRLPIESARNLRPEPG